MRCQNLDHECRTVLVIPPGITSVRRTRGSFGISTNFVLGQIQPPLWLVTRKSLSDLNCSWWGKTEVFSENSEVLKMDFDMQCHMCTLTFLTRASLIDRFSMTTGRGGGGRL